MRVQTFPVGELKANCHVVVNEEVNQAVFIDCGGEPVKLLNYLTRNGLELKAILLTHGHYDHFEGVAYVQEKTNCKVYISRLDSSMLTSSIDSLAKLLDYDSFNPVSDYVTVSDGDVITEANLEFRVLSTAGHTQGSVCYVCNECLFTGDTLFKRSMGRTDFPTGSYFDMQKSLQRLYNLEGNYSVYTGHDSNTDLQSERDYNPRMRDAVNDDYYLY